MDLQALNTELQELKETVARLQAEVRTVLRGRARVDAEAIEELLGYVHNEFEQRPWTAADVLEQSADSPFLLGALRRCLGKQITLKKLSHFLGDAFGLWGAFRLECTENHSRDGRLFRVTKFVTSSQIHDGTV